MSTTERLYYDDSHLLEFDARVLAVNERVDGSMAVTLDRTAFYPTGGGQPNDTGTLGDARVVDCIESEDGQVLHIIEGKALHAHETVKGRIDGPRRLDHLQQHTGQHMLSQAFVSLFEAETRGFRMMAQVSEIDVALDQPSDDKIEQAVDLANKIIWENRAVNVQTVTPERAAALPLRKEPSVAGELRLIEIVGFDLTPCGGTHAQRTGEVGLIAVRSWERAKGLTRIEFVAGDRALADYRRANETARKIAALFSAGRDDAADLAARMLEENKELHRRLRALEEVTARIEAEELLKQTITTAGVSEQGSSPTSGSPAGQPGWGGTVREGSITLVAKIFDGRDAESLKRLAIALVAHRRVIALLASRDKETARLVFARSADAPGDMNALMREACVMIDGRGGGKPDMAQGGGRNVEKLGEALDQTARALSKEVERVSEVRN